MPAEQRRRQILKSAITVFARSTYHGATTKSISEEAGVTEALIYRYFGSKRALFTEAIGYVSERIVSGVRRILEEHRDEPLVAIQTCFEYYARQFNEHEYSAKMLFLVFSELDQQDVRDAYLPHQRAVVSEIARTIKHWKELGFVDPALDSRSAAWLFFGAYMVLALVRYSHGTLEVDPASAVALAKPYLDLAALDEADHSEAS